MSGFVLRRLTLPLPSLLVPTPSTKGGVGRADSPSYLKNRCPHERELLHGIRDVFESLRNIKVLHSVYLVTIATPQRRGVLEENR